ncbi:MAG: histidine--tRNA ligase [Bacteroidota bacterium]
MAKEKPGIPKGTRDFGPQEVAKRKYILNTIEQVFIKYGFMPIETPTMENLSTLTGKYGDEGDKLLFKVLNSGEYLDKVTPEILSTNNTQLATKLISEKGLRYDLTVPFARYVVMHQNEITFPFKRYQMQPVWRADKPQKGRYREFWQCDADVVGSDSLLNELDLTNIYLEVFKALDVEVGIQINNRKILQGIADYFGCSDKLVEFITILDKLDKVGYDSVVNELREKNIIQNSNFDKIELGKFSEGIQTYQKWEEQLNRLKQDFESVNSTIGIAGVEELRDILKFIPVSENVRITPTLARGLSYYTGTIWEVVVLDEKCSLKSSIGGGGRYDNLTGIFGLNGVSGVGISFGLDRIYDVIEELNKFPVALNQSSTKVLVCCFEENDLPQALLTLKQLREANIPAEIYADKVNPKKPLEKPIKYATGKKIPYALLYNTDGSLTLKNLLAGTQENVLLNAAINQISQSV